jgi:hypothetical protein
MTNDGGLDNLEDEPFVKELTDICYGNPEKFMNKNINFSRLQEFKEFGKYLFLTVLFPAAIIGTMILGQNIYSNYRKNQECRRLYEELSISADRIFGNNNGNLEKSEELKWFNAIGVLDGKKPTNEQLKVFKGLLKTYENNEVYK